MRITTRISFGILCAALVGVAACGRESSPPYRTFPTPEDAVRALISAAASDKVDQVVAIFGPEGKELLDNSDPASGRRARQVFSAAAAEGWRLTDREGGGRTLVVGNEEWPFPVPLVRESNGWRFDTAAGREEIISRRIGRNELSVIDTCETYALAQHIYARDPHDGRPSGVYASVFRSDDGKENGLYWAATRTGKRSPLGDRLAAAAYHPASQASGQPAPFHGYYFRILTAQGPSAPGGAKRLHGQRRNDRRIRARRVARPVRRHRGDDVHCRRGRHRPSEGSGPGHRCGRPRDGGLRSRRVMDTGPVIPQIAEE